MVETWNYKSDAPRFNLVLVNTTLGGAILGYLLPDFTSSNPYSRSCRDNRFHTGFHPPHARGWNLTTPAFCTSTLRACDTGLLWEKGTARLAKLPGTQAHTIQKRGGVNVNRATLDHEEQKWSIHASPAFITWVDSSEISSWDSSGCPVGWISSHLWCW